MKRDEDLFKNTTMTFGEHLDELRVALFKALLGLVIGTLFGLLVGKQFVLLMEKPLTEALGDYYTTDAEIQYAAFAKERTDAGKPVPYTQEQVQNLVREHGLIFDIHYILPNDKAGALQVAQPNATTEELAKQLEPLILWHPAANDSRVKIKAFGVPETFSIWLKASLVVGALLSSPWVFFHIWSFVAAGLYPHEKNYVHIFLPFSLGLFFLGAATAYLFVFGPVLKFLFDFNRWLGIDPDPRITEWLSFVLLLPLGFGASFQLPLVMLFMERIGVFGLEDYIKQWKLSIFGIVVIAAVLTPADPYSFFLMAIPLIVLYFFGLGLCKFMPRPRPAVE